MKKEIMSGYISLISVLLFIFISYACFVRINKAVNTAKSNVNVFIYSFDSDNANLVINPSKLNGAKDTPVATKTIRMSVKYQNPLEKDKTFKLIMENLNEYNKTEGVSNKTKEYTYEIKKNGKTIISETQFDSYTKDSKLTLMKDKISDSAIAYEYQIVLRFYSNEYNQNHLLGTSFNSKLSIK